MFRGAMELDYGPSHDCVAPCEHQCPAEILFLGRRWVTLIPVSRVTTISSPSEPACDSRLTVENRERRRRQELRQGFRPLQVRFLLSCGALGRTIRRN